MANYSLNNFKRFLCHLSDNDYWDMHINDADVGAYSFNDIEQNENCLSCFIDTSIEECVQDKYLISNSGNTWSGACSKGINFENIGLTGVDNGLITYRKDRITNKEFLDIYTNSTYEIDLDDLRLHLHMVSGTTQLYDYPCSINEDKSIKLNGGFYQGFFQSGNNYSILPSNIENEWNFEFMLKPENYEPESSKTLNDTYPDNKGMFFYIGTRAENKWVYLYDNPPSGETSWNDYWKDFGECNSGYTEFDDDIFDTDGLDDEFIEDDIEIKDIKFETSNGYQLESANDDYIVSNNNFLIYDRTPDGLLVCNDGIENEVMLSFKKKRFNENLFLYLNRTPSGYTAQNVHQIIDVDINTYDYFYKDIYSNALAFIIKDDGSIGYRYLIKDCSGDAEGHFSVIEGYSYPNIIKLSEWAKINVKIKSSEKYMEIYFYVNGKLKYITDYLPKLDLHKLEELDEKQEGVAYNISIGGGTQGLAETVLPDYMKNPTKIYPLEKNFAGSFIGDFKYFKFYTC